MQKTAGWSNTSYGVVYGEKKINGDANEGAYANAGTWKGGCEYVICVYHEMTPGAFAAVPWQDSFFLGVGFTNDHYGGHVLVDYGIGGEKGSSKVFIFLPGVKKVSSVNPCYFIDEASGSRWNVQFLFDGTIQKQWQGFGDGEDTYLIILERGVF